MAGTGPAPSERKRRRNADAYASGKVTIVEDGELRGPEPGAGWPPAVKVWFEAWRRSPQAAVFLETDWMRLRLLAPLVNAYLANPRPTALAEIRVNESLLGATHLDRLRARMKVEQPEPGAAPAGVTALDEYRNRLTS